MDACRKIIFCCTLARVVSFALILEFGDGQPGDKYDAAGRVITYTLDDPARAIAIGQRHGIHILPARESVLEKICFKIFGTQKIFSEGSRRVSRLSQ
jgi:hypothetical protein